MDMKKVLSVMNGFNYSLSTNANAICLYKIIKADKGNFYVVITDIKPDFWVTFPENLQMIYYDFSAWKKTWKIKKIIKDLSDISLNIIDDWYYKNLFLISFPNLNLHLGVALKNRDPDIALFFYELDPFAYNKGYRSRKLFFLIRRFIEAKAFHEADKIFLTHELHHNYLKSQYRKFANKMVILAQPTIDNEQYEMLSFSKRQSDKIIFSYFGTINNTFRDPTEYLEEFCDALTSIDINYEIRFYGSDEKYLKDFLFTPKYNVKVFPFISQEDYLKILDETHFLLNISNKDLGNVMPSKLLEYIGTGLPLINFVDNSNNVTIKILKNYPLSLNFYSVNNQSFVSENVQNFVISNFEERLDWKIIEDFYSEFISDSVAKKINVFIK